MIALALCGIVFPLFSGPAGAEDDDYDWLEGPQVLGWTFLENKDPTVVLLYVVIERSGDRFSLKPLLPSEGMSGEGEIDREKESLRFRLAGPDGTSDVFESNGVLKGGAAGAMIFGRKSEDRSDGGTWTLRPFPPPEALVQHAEKDRAGAGIGREGVEPFAEVTERMSYEAACARSEVEPAVPVRMRVLVFDRDRPFDRQSPDLRFVVSEEIGAASDEGPEGKVGPPPFCVASILGAAGSKGGYPSLAMALGEPSYEEGSGVLVGGKYQPLFPMGNPPGGWESAVVRAVVGKDSFTIQLNLGLKVPGVKETLGIETVVWADQWTMIAGPVTEERHRIVFIHLEPVEGKTGADAKEESDAIDALPAGHGDPAKQRYDEIRSRPNAEEGVPVRLHLDVYDRKEPFAIVREDVARIEPALDEEKEPVDPAFGISTVFTEPQMAVVLRAIDEAGWKPIYGEIARVIPGGRLQPFFAEGAVPKGWEDSFIRADVDANRWTVSVGLALKAAGVEKASGESITVWTGQTILLSGPVSEGLHRTVFLRVESVKPPADVPEN